MVDRELREIIRFHQGKGGALDAALHAQRAQHVTDQRGLPGPQVAPQGDDKRLSLKVLRGQCLGQGLGPAAGLPFVGQPVSLQFRIPVRWFPANVPAPVRTGPGTR